jgi:Protein of unknown function (DUF2380)
MNRSMNQPFAVLLIAVVSLCAGLDRPSRAEGEPPAMAVAEIQYVDTSGEPVDQSVDHFRRLREFETSLRSDLAAGGKVRTVSLDCPASACSIGEIEAPQLLDKAQAAGAAYLLIGSIHKQSTLIQWAKFDLIDVKARNVVFNRLVTFRGDNDKAWTHAESFVVREILDHQEN